MSDKSALPVLAIVGTAVVGVYLMTKKKTTPEKTIVTTAFASIESYLVRVWVMRGDIWYMYDPADSIGSNLTYVESGEVLSISVSQNCTLTYGSKSWELKSGWNNIRW